MIASAIAFSTMRPSACCACSPRFHYSSRPRLCIFPSLAKTAMHPASTCFTPASLLAFPSLPTPTIPPLPRCSSPRPAPPIPPVKLSQKAVSWLDPLSSFLPASLALPPTNPDQLCSVPSSCLPLLPCHAPIMHARRYPPVKPLATVLLQTAADSLEARWRQLMQTSLSQMLVANFFTESTHRRWNSTPVLPGRWEAHVLRAHWRALEAARGVAAARTNCSPGSLPLFKVHTCTSLLPCTLLHT